MKYWSWYIFVHVMVLGTAAVMLVTVIGLIICIFASDVFNASHQSRVFIRSWVRPVTMICALLSLNTVTAMALTDEMRDLRWERGEKKKKA